MVKKLEIEAIVVILVLAFLLLISITISSTISVMEKILAVVNKCVNLLSRFYTRLAEKLQLMSPETQMEIIILILVLMLLVLSGIIFAGLL
jgi:hypothetical protein